MEVKFEEKFEEVLKEESKAFGIDWSLVEIKHIHYSMPLKEALPLQPDEYLVRLRVLEVEIPEMEVDKWFRSHNFIHGIMSKSVRTEQEEPDIVTLDIGTIESIASKIRDTFRNFPRQSNQGQPKKKTAFGIDDSSDFIKIPPASEDSTPMEFEQQILS